MPHFLNVDKVKPLQWHVSEWSYDPKSLSHFQLTGNHMHAQPIVCRFKDQSVGCIFFGRKTKPHPLIIIISHIWLNPLITERDARFLRQVELLPKTCTTTCLVPEEVERVPVPHIHRIESLVDRLDSLKMEHKDIDHFNDSPPEA